MFTAWQLAQRGHSVTVLEREAHVGGLGASIERAGNTYGFGTHHLHSADPNHIAPFRDLVGTELVEMDRKLLIKFMGRFYPYPLQTADMLRGMPLPTLVSSTASLAKAMLANRFHRAPPAHAEEAVIRLYGRKLYDLMFRDYTTRFWGVPPTEISSTFVDKRMPGISAVENIKKFLSKLAIVNRESLGKTVQIGSGKMYTTPRGVGLVYSSMADRIRELGGRVLTSSEVSAVQCGGDGLVSGVTIRGPEGEQRLPCELLVSTMPISHLAQRIRPGLPKPVCDAASQLGYRALLVAGVLIRPKKPLNALFTYFPDRVFHRLAELKGQAEVIRPAGCSILLAELTCDTSDAIWRDPSLIEGQLVRDLVAEQLVEPNGVLEIHYLKAPEAYPKYFLGFETALEKVKTHLREITNLVSTGRQGNFQFTSMIPTMHMAWSDTQAALQRVRERHSAVVSG